MSEKTTKKKEEETAFEHIEYVADAVKESKKKVHGTLLKSIIIPMDDMNEKHKEILVLVPSRHVVGQHLKYLQSDPKKAQEILIKNCLVTSKEEVLDDDNLFYSAAGMLMELIPVRQGKFGKV